MKRVLITGASGLIGKSLSEFLKKKDFEVLKLSRSNVSIPNTFKWDVDSGNL